MEQRPSEWINATGSPTNAIRPFSTLNPNASEFVPGAMTKILPCTSNWEQPTTQPPFSFEQCIPSTPKPFSTPHVEVVQVPNYNYHQSLYLSQQLPNKPQDNVTIAQPQSLPNPSHQNSTSSWQVASSQNIQPTQEENNSSEYLQNRNIRRDGRGYEQETFSGNNRRDQEQTERFSKDTRNRSDFQEDWNDAHRNDHNRLGRGGGHFQNASYRGQFRLDRTGPRPPRKFEDQEDKTTNVTYMKPSLEDSMFDKTSHYGFGGDKSRCDPRHPSGTYREPFHQRENTCGTDNVLKQSETKSNRGSYQRGRGNNRNPRRETENWKSEEHGGRYQRKNEADSDDWGSTTVDDKDTGWTENKFERGPYQRRCDSNRNFRRGTENRRTEERDGRYQRENKRAENQGEINEDSLSNNWSEESRSTKQSTNAKRLTSESNRKFKRDNEDGKRSKQEDWRGRTGKTSLSTNNDDTLEERKEDLDDGPKESTHHSPKRNQTAGESNRKFKSDGETDNRKKRDGGERFQKSNKGGENKSKKLENEETIRDGTESNNQSEESIGKGQSPPSSNKTENIYKNRDGKIKKNQRLQDGEKHESSNSQSEESAITNSLSSDKIKNIDRKQDGRRSKYNQEDKQHNSPQEESVEEQSTSFKTGNIRRKDGGKDRRSERFQRDDNGEQHNSSNSHSEESTEQQSATSFKTGNNSRKDGRKSKSKEDGLSLMETIMAKEVSQRSRLSDTIKEEKTKSSESDPKTSSNKKISSEQILSPEIHRSTTDYSKYLDPRMEREKLKKEKNSTVDSRIISMDSHLVEKERLDKDFDLWENHWQKVDEFKIVQEIEANLFEQPKDYSLAHCVAEDLRMGSGIAVLFKREFKNLPDLLDQKAKQGGLAVVSDNENHRFVYYLVTKRESSGKPTYLTLWKSLCKMREHIKENKVKKVAIPRLACGLDRLEWDRVKSMIEWLFKDIDLEVRVCNFQQSELIEDKKSKCKLVIQETPVTKIEGGTLIIYLATCKGEADNIIKQLSNKIGFLPAFEKHSPKNLGDIIYYNDEVNNYGLCGCIVRKTRNETISYKSLLQCIQKFNKTNRAFGNDAFNYVACQWVDEEDYCDELVNNKIITMLINFLRDVDVYICKGQFEDEEHGK